MGDEQSKAKIDDLQILLTEEEMTLTNRDTFDETNVLPENYFEWKRLSAQGVSECCNKPKNMVIYLAEEANVDSLLRDDSKKPSFEWGETFCTLKGNKARVFTNDEFTLENTILSYYRQPLKIQIEGCVDPYTQVLSTVNVECEF